VSDKENGRYSSSNICVCGLLQVGPALAGAGPNARPRCGAPLSRGVTSKQFL